MTTSRSFRRSAQRAAAKATVDHARLLREARRTPARRVASLDGRLDVWKRGEVAFVLPRIIETDSHELREAIARRRLAALDGRCPCGAVMTLEAGVMTFRHEDDCPAQTDVLAALLRKERP